MRQKAESVENERRGCGCTPKGFLCGECRAGNMVLASWVCVLDDSIRDCELCRGQEQRVGSVGQGCVEDGPVL